MSSNSPGIPGTFPEILAPGGSLRSILAAMEAGADAIYVGVGEANARVRASNLNLVQLTRVTADAVRRKVRIYTAVNVPLQKGNRQALLDAIVATWVSGADAVILRDFHLVDLVRRELPTLAIHLSTQAGVATAKQAELARDRGVSRIVLARELTREQMAEIHRCVPEVELEAFVLGAMCFGVSGSCLLGHAVDRRSGNYGHCGQPCRLSYVDGDGTPRGYPISMRDLDLSGHIPDLMDAGIVSLKIEGRLKSPEWVSCAVSGIRRAADKAREGGLTPQEAQRFDRDLSVLFSRPRGPGFFLGAHRRENLVCSETPGHAGWRITEWSVKTVRGQNMLVLVPRLPLGLRDGLLLGWDDGSGHLDFRPFPIDELLGSRGQAVGRSAPDEEVFIPLGPLSGTLKEVRIHSCKAIRDSYGSTDLRRLREWSLDTLPDAVVTDGSFQSDSLQLTGVLGRIRVDGEWPLTSQESKDEAASRDLLERIFPGAGLSGVSGRSFSPAALKSIRRSFRAAGNESFEASRSRLSARLRQELKVPESAMLPDDDALLQEDLACVSRVTGFESGFIETSGGDRFELRPLERGTALYRVRRRS